MKKILIPVFLLLFSAPAFGATWCEWSGTEGVNCQSDSRGYVRATADNHPIGASEENLNYHGFYELIVTEPSLGPNQVKDAVVWGFAANQISKTWTVRDLTTTELDQREARAMPLSEYYLWRALIVKGVITQQEAVDALPSVLIDAYLARDRLENP
jgi:hypothetical protein